MDQLDNLDINMEEQSPLAYADAFRKRSLVPMVEAAVKDGNTMLAFQSIVSDVASRKIIFYERLIRIPDPMGRIIPAAQFIDKVEEREMGRLIDCLVLDMRLRSLVRVPNLKS